MAIIKQSSCYYSALSLICSVSALQLATLTSGPSHVNGSAQGLLTAQPSGKKIAIAFYLHFIKICLAIIQTCP